MQHSSVKFKVNFFQRRCCLFWLFSSFPEFFSPYSAFAIGILSLLKLKKFHKNSIFQPSCQYWLLRCWLPDLFCLPDLRHSDHDGGEAQVQPQPGGVHLCRPQPLPGHRQPVPLPPADLWKFKVITTMNISSKFGTF